MAVGACVAFGVLKCLSIGLQQQRYRNYSVRHAPQTSLLAARDSTDRDSLSIPKVVVNEYRASFACSNADVYSRTAFVDSNIWSCRSLCSTRRVTVRSSIVNVSCSAQLIAARDRVTISILAAVIQTRHGAGPHDVFQVIYIARHRALTVYYDERLAVAGNRCISCNRSKFIQSFKMKYGLLPTQPHVTPAARRTLRHPGLRSIRLPIRPAGSSFLNVRLCARSE